MLSLSKTRRTKEEFLTPCAVQHGRVPWAAEMRYPMEAPGRGCGRDLDPIGQHRTSGGRLAQRESASFTPRRSLVRSQYRPPGQGPMPTSLKITVGAIPARSASRYAAGHGGQAWVGRRQYLLRSRHVGCGGDHVDLEGDPDADPPVPPHVDVWRSVRANGTPRRRSPGALWECPGWPLQVLREYLERRAAARRRAGVLWEDNGLVFTTALGTQLDAADVRRSLRTICMKAGIGKEWTPGSAY